MQLLTFLLLYPIIWLISKLPFRVLYFTSDLVYILVYYLIGYRKKIVRQNIASALPHLTQKERIVIEKKSYRHLCDMFLEMMKTMSLSEEEMDKRFTFTNIEALIEMEKQGKSIAVMMAHYASYEWAISLNKYSNLTSYAIYKRVGNTYFDKMVKDIRLKFKALLITTRETIPTIEKNHLEKRLGLYGFASDQSPQLSKTHHWGTFLGIETPIHTGAEMLVKRFDMNVIFLKVKKVKRGYYEATLETMFDHPSEVPNYQISEEFLRRVEKQIYEAPEYYLWTHKRWKHKKK
ncbi:lysophospholipid acyltransferase family protein [Flavobacterium sp. J49]|uniref:lysophospholipid acyltransferase family protein n=1 Tax=Flavobacterium sp. J49 TaxID=2718534 RepID=UPI001592BC72|nr:lysophospholipid acyltransferase family protein [Flavobacterium sp. J49]MBF6640047.1 lysophospholipid acyltransferase family protein [Flavobacterium sp. J49]NIC01292.1 lipid A biosynthesis acyltransferase [Flavobacterium sp. J49]